MKKEILLFIVFIAALNHQSFPQAISPVSKFYINISPVIKPQAGDDGSGSEIGFTCVIRNKLSFSFARHFLHINPSNLPKDFDPGYVEGFAIFFPYWGKNVDPTVNCEMYSATIGRYFSLGKRSWFQLEGGPSLMASKKTSFTKQAVTTETYNYLLGYETSTSSNYKVEKVSKAGMGLLLRADIHHAITRNLGMGFSINSEISSIQSPLFFELRLIGGHFGLPKKTKPLTHKTKKP